VTAIGFRIKSGYAIAVVLAGPAKSPTVVGRHIVDLCDPEAAETKQPYHDGFGTENEDPREIARRVKIIERCAKRSVGDLIKEVRRVSASASPGATASDRSAKGVAERSELRAGLVVGSIIDPRQVGNPHIRAHANEGKLFRTVVADALESHGIRCDVIVEKQLAATASAGLGKSDGEIKQALAAFGKSFGGPWRAEEKAAATAAWLALGPAGRST
jgi:hypothetical protein